MNAIYNTTAGVNITFSPTNGWLTQNWWKSESDWKSINDASPELLSDLRACKTKEMPKELSDLFFEEVKKQMTKPVDGQPVPVPMPELTPEQIAAALKEMKESLDRKADHVDVNTVDEFLSNVGHMWAVCQMFNIKVFDTLGEVRIVDAIPMALRVHGHYIAEFHFPDGDKYEVVMRHRDTTDEIRSFAYKL